jgi:hypothetical protein
MVAKGEKNWGIYAAKSHSRRSCHRGVPSCIETGVELKAGFRVLFRPTRNTRVVGAWIMTSLVPALDPWGPQCDQPISTDGSQLSPFAPLAMIAPRRSPLVSWPVRMAQVADRVVARALPARQTALGSRRGLAEITLAGLDHVCRLIPYHQEIVVAERAKLRIHQAIARREDRYRQFLELRQAMPDQLAPVDLDGSPRLHLNPANCWLRWTAENATDGEATTATSALFFLHDSELRGMRMRLEGQVLINELADYEPCTVAQWAELSALTDRSQLVAFARHLIAIGLVAHS